ncbi:hypothetical protein [Cryobacterium soli]|uniref:hypothetical protein n=1 Tax=Cryobacterium soli TaxID=2220095 RepID=UPI000E765AA7|nr:hypothetical protein [Cryobacterium soli]
MAKDERLYARFDIAMDEHPKVMLLSDAAFRTLFEATFYSRRQLTDGFLAEGVVRRRWSPEAIAELRANDPEKPSLYPFEKAGVAGLMIHDYDKHQTTTADIEAKREAGRKGGRAKAENAASKPVAGASEVLGQKASTTPTPPLAITETETETTTSNEVVKTPGAKAAPRGTLLPEPFMVTREMRDWAAVKVPGIDVNEATEAFVDYWRGRAGAGARKADWPATWRNSLRAAYGRAAGMGRPVKKPKAEQVLDVVALGRRMQEEHDRKAIGA